MSRAGGQDAPTENFAESFIIKLFTDPRGIETWSQSDISLYQAIPKDHESQERSRRSRGVSQVEASRRREARLTDLSISSL